ncbi:MAG TPA: hypothetical protein ENN99_07685 [Chloroflexi bacterium]|mgnify:CR=1 FL=1|nr:hypothetical protein [Chloroflexota bacterium]
MIDQTERDPWRMVWQIATSNQWMAALLLCIAAGLLLATWLPQMPTSDPPPPAAYAQWLSDAQARFGNATSTMQALGFFHVTRSLGLRLLLILLAATLLLHLIEGIDQLWQHRTVTQPATEWRSLAATSLPNVLGALSHRHRVLSAPPLHQADHWPWADLLPLLPQTGGLLLLLGALLTHLWGWQVDGLIVQGGERTLIPNTNRWIVLDKTARSAAHSPGIVVFITDQVPGVRAYAYDETGKPLALQRAAGSPPLPQLAIALTEEQVLAIPEAQLYIRLTPQTESIRNPTADLLDPILVQMYQSPPGRLIQQTVIEEDTELAVGDVKLHLDGLPYARLTAVFNPGLWFTAAGVVLLVVGLVGCLIWPTRRIWLREGEQVETTGDPLPPLAQRTENGEA